MNRFLKWKGISYIDDELSGWKHMNTGYEPSNYLTYINVKLLVLENSSIIIKKGYVVEEKGTGSAFGGEWRPSPNKPNDWRFLGKPREIKISYNRKGEKIATKIGNDGRAVKERHYSDHKQPWAHTDPHDHEISWSKEFPDPQSPINYSGVAPEFKYYVQEDNDMSKPIDIDLLDDSLNFETISDFKWCMKYGGEVEFAWKDKTYCAFGKLEHPETLQIKICICEAYKPKTAGWYDTPDEALEYLVDGVERLRDIITQVKVIDRTL